MKGKIIGYDAKGPNGMPVLAIEFAHMDMDTSIPLNKEIDIDLEAKNE